MLLTREDANNPEFSVKGRAALFGSIFQERSQLQATAATLAGQFVLVAEFDGRLGEAVFTTSAVPGAGESMVVDVLKNGVSVLAATNRNDTMNAASAPQKQLIPNLDIDKCQFARGDVFTVSRTYTAGGSPAPIANTSAVLRLIPHLL